MQKTIYLKGLNGIRAIAALSVVVSHIIKGFENFGLKSIESGYQFASYGVTMFFTLSGFLITFLLIKEKETYSSISIKNFYIRRILRIWPLYYFYLLLALIVMYYYFPGALPGSIAFYLFLSANIPYVLNTSLPLLEHYWSLGVEEQFYLIWPWLFKKYSPLKAVLIFLFIFLFIKLILRILVPLSIEYQFISVTKFDCMAIGALFAILFTYHATRFKNFCFTVFAQLISWGILVIAAFNYLKIPDFINHDVLSIATGIIIINVAFNTKTLINLDNTLFNFTGKISYGIYVYHPMIIFLGGKLLKGFFSFNNVPLQILIVFIVVLTLTILVSFASYKLFEKNFLNLKTKYAKIPSHT